MKLFLLIDFISIIVAIIMGMYVYLKNPSNKLHKIFLLNSLLACYTAICEFFMLHAEGISSATFWHKASFVWPFFPFIFYLFILAFTDSKLYSSKKINLILIFPAVIITGLHLFSNIVYKSPVFAWYGWNFPLTKDLYLIFIPVYFIFLTILSFGIILRYYIASKDSRDKTKALYVILGLFIPLLTGMMSAILLPEFDISTPPLAFLGFLIGTAFLSIGILKYGIFIPDPQNAIKKIFASILDYMVVIDSEGKIILASNSFIKCVEYDESEILNKRVENFITDVVNPKNKGFFVEIGKEKELVIKTKNKQVQISAVMSIISGSALNYENYLLVGRDISERKRYEEKLLLVQKELEEKVRKRTAELEAANKELKVEISERNNIESELRESETKYRSIFNFAPVGIFQSYKDGGIKIANQTFANILGYDSVEEVLSLNMLDIYYDKNERDKLIGKYMPVGEAIGIELKWKTKSRLPVWVQLSAHIMKDNVRNANYFEGFVVDINNKKLIEDELGKSEERYRNLFENSPIGIYRTAPNGQILFANPAILKMLHYDDFSEIIGRNLEEEDFKTSSYQRKIFKTKIEENGEIVGWETKWLRKDGSPIYVRENARCVYNDEGKVLFYDGTVEDVTEKIKSEIALKKSEEKYRNLIENINELYLVSDLRGRAIYISPNIKSLTGYSVNDWVGNDVLEFIYQDDREKVKKFYKEKSFNGTKDDLIEFRSVKKDGTISWVEQMTRFVRNSKGQVTEYRNVIRDITERKNSEEKIRLLAQAVKSTGEGISITDLNNNILFVNDAFKEIYGYTEEELLGSHINIVGTKNEPTPLLMEEIRKETTVKGWKGELVNSKKDGTEFPIYLSTSSVRNDKGEPYAFVGVTRDITGQKENEKQLEDYRYRLEELVEERTRKIDTVNRQLTKEIEKLKKAEAKIQNHLTFLETLIDTIPNPVFIRDKNKNYTGCNRAYETIYDVKRKELLGKNVFYLGSKVQADFISQKDEELLKNPGEQKYETISYNKEGSEHVHLVHKATFRETDGTIGGIIGVMLDITEIKKLESDILNTLRKEKELSELKSRFISVASHEFRTPLTTILSSADLLELYGRKWPDIKYYEYVSKIQNAVEYMTGLINDVLIISRSETNQVSFNPTNVDLFELSKNIFDNVKLTAPPTIEMNFNYKLKERIFFLDNKLLTQIITNLLSNAIKYSPNGGIVNFTISGKEKCLSLVVTDAGIGIPKEDQSRLFEPFYRAQNVGTIAGTGLGLSIVKRSAEAHNGKLVLESEVNKGTKAKVFINCG